MASKSGNTTSVWMDTPMPEFPALVLDNDTEVCVIGGGIAGMTTAYLLRREGRAVVLIDGGAIGGGETGRTTAHLASAIDEGFREIERLHGEDGVRLAYQSHAAAIDLIETIVEREGIACDFERVDGYRFVPPGEPVDALGAELAAARRAGVPVQRLPRAPLRFFDTGPCLRYRRQAQFHPLKYLAGLARCLQAAGGEIYTNTRANAIEVDDLCRVALSSGATVTCDAVVVATNTPISDRVAAHTKQAAYRTYVIAARIPRGSVPRALLWDTAEPYHYVRVATLDHEAEDVLLVGGEDHETGQADDTGQRFARLQRWMRERFPMVAGTAFRWSGQIMEPVDGLAFIGHDPLERANVFIATGDSGNGMTHGTIAGQVLCDLVHGRTNPLAYLYDPRRRSLHAADFAREHANVVVQYADWLRPGDFGSIKEVAADSGAVLRRGPGMLAVYRDEHKELYICDARCPHSGCVVDWNPTDRTWDCPCHGSRFDRYGQVINGPANSDLEQVEVPLLDRRRKRRG